MDTQQWFPVVTLVIGLVLGYVGDWLRDERTARRERETRRKQFQRETITEAQDVIEERFHLQEASHFLGEDHLHRTGHWPRKDEPDVDAELSSQSSKIALRLITLKSRIEDEQLGTILMRIVVESGDMSVSDSGESADEALERTLDSIKEFHARAKQVLIDLC